MKSIKSISLFILTRMTSYGFTATDSLNILPPLLTSFSSSVPLPYDQSKALTLLPQPSSLSSQDLTPTSPLSLSLSSLSKPFSPESSTIQSSSGTLFFLSFVLSLFHLYTPFSYVPILVFLLFLNETREASLPEKWNQTLISSKALNLLPSTLLSPT